MSTNNAAEKGVNMSKSGGPSKPYDLFGSQFKADPFPTFAHMREHAPVYDHRAPDGSTIWYITRYEEVMAVLQDDHNFCKDPRSHGLSAAKNAALRRTTLHRLVNENMLFADPPDHTRLRALVSQAFTPQRVSTLATFIERAASNLIEEFVARQEVDIISAYALPLPVIVICHLLGISEQDRQAVTEWSQAIISPGSRNLNYTQRKRNVQELLNYLEHLFDLRLASPQDDLISALVHAEQAGDKLDRFELSSMVILLLVTGHETTVNLIGNGALTLIEHKEQLAQLRQNPGLWPDAVEELLRYDGPVETSTSRWAKRDVQMLGHTIRRGDLVRVVLASANRDETIFEAPQELRLDRQNNRHVAFGYGIHYCLGAPLARLEGRIALRLLFEKLHDIRLGPGKGALPWRSGVLFRGLESLWIVWDNLEASDGIMS